MTRLSWTDCPFGVPASADAMTEEQEHWALGQMALERIEENDGQSWILAEDLPG